MIRNVYTVRDRLTHFLDLRVMENDAVAMRWFEDLMLAECKENPRKAADYSLFCVGSYDDENGQLHEQEPNVPELLILGTEVMEKYGLSD